MADRSSLQLIGFVISGLAFSVALIAAVLVHKTVTGKIILDQPVPIVYDWAPYDSLIDAAARYGIRVQLTVTGGAPAWW